MTETKKMTQTESETEKSWTWQEISEHSNNDSCWIYVNRDVYDVTKWLPKHPGGDELILLFSGRDCTEAFRTYHAFTEKPFAMIEKFKIGTLKGPSEVVRFKEDSGFYKTLRERIGDYFRKRNIDPVKREASYEIIRMISSIGMYMLLPWIALVALKWYAVPMLLRMLLVIPAGLCGCMVALNVGHMASHVPTFHMPRLNSFLGWLSWDVCLGFSTDVWLIEHVVGHHQYTNIIAIDPNAPESNEEEFLYRGAPTQKWYKGYLYQFIWMPLLSCMLIVEIRVAAYRYWFKGFRNNIRVNGRFKSTEKLMVFLLGKLIWAFRSYYLPIFVWKVPILEALLFVTLNEIIGGYFVGILIPASHITTKSYWPTMTIDEKTGEKRIDQEWAIMEVRTCKDYDCDNWVFKHVFGSLNNHSCHHLFPAMHHTYYEEIYPIVKQTAKDFNIELHDVGKWYELFYDYVMNLWHLARDPKKAL